MVFKYLFSSVALPPNQHMWVCKALCVHLIWIVTAKETYKVDRLNARDLAANQALLNHDSIDQNINTNVSSHVTQKLQMWRNMFVRLPFELSQNDFKLVSHLCHLFKTILLRIYSSQGCARIQGYCFRATNLGLLNNARNKRLLNNAFFDVITVRYPSTEDPPLQPCHPKRGCAPLVRYPSTEYPPLQPCHHKRGCAPL